VTDVPSGLSFIPPQKIIKKKENLKKNFGFDPRITQKLGSYSSMKSLCSVEGEDDYSQDVFLFPQS
jgi:hypothetical protein